MKAYVIAAETVHDAAMLDQYRAAVLFAYEGGTAARLRLGDQYPSDTRRATEGS